MRPRLTFVIGPTNAGKGTLLALAGKLPHVGLVEVGKMMRAKYLDPASPHYDPDHFKGQGAPKHTAVEAWQMMLDGIAAAEAAKKDVVLIDGQPRDVEQARRCAFELELYEKRFIALHASHEIRLRRAIRRDGGDLTTMILDELEKGHEPDPHDSFLPPPLRLSLARMTSDYKAVYHVLSELSLCGRIVFTYRTDEDMTPDGYPYRCIVSAITESKRIPGQQSLFDE